MRFKSNLNFIMLIVFILLFSMGCRSQNEEDIPTEPAPETTGFQIVATPGKELLGRNDALYGYEGVSLGYASELTNIVTGSKQPAYADFGIFYTSSGNIQANMPDYIEITLQTDNVPARIGVQPIRTVDNQSFSSFSPEVIQRNSTLENDVLNQLGAAELVPTPPKLAYIEFANGIGRRYLAFNGETFANEDLYYVFEGVTSNGRYSIWFEYPLSTTFLDTIDADTTAETIISQLDDLPSETFTPELIKLDAVVTSFQIEPTESYTYAAPDGANPGNLIVTLGDVIGDIPPEVYAINQETNQQFTSQMPTGMGLKQVTMTVPAGEYQLFAHLPGDLNGTFLGYWDVSSGDLKTITVNTNETNSEPILTLADDPCIQVLPATPDEKYPATDSDTFQNLTGCVVAVAPGEGNSSLYTVKEGDTLLSISRVYNIDWQRIARMNDLVEPYFLQPGQELIIPAP